MGARRAAKVDANQPEIVAALREIPGVSVEVDHDDLLVGRGGRTYWFELKHPDAISKRTGAVKPSEITDSEIDRLANWKGHYRIVWTLDQILSEIFTETMPEVELEREES